jgi:DNA helicase-2/ATP-dependent DNA helicase PcrA
MRELYLTFARRRSVFGSQSYALSSRFIDEIPAELCERGDLPSSRPGALAGTGGQAGGARLGLAGIARGHSGGVSQNGARARRSAAPAWLSDSGSSSSQSFRLGEDVVHAAFGEGVITGVEPGGIVVVRFSRDGSERKLMADYAPVSRR